MSIFEILHCWYWSESCLDKQETVYVWVLQEWGFHSTSSLHPVLWLNTCTEFLILSGHVGIYLFSNSFRTCTVYSNDPLFSKHWTKYNFMSSSVGRCFSMSRGRGHLDNNAMTAFKTLTHHGGRTVVLYSMNDGKWELPFSQIFTKAFILCVLKINVHNRTCLGLGQLGGVANLSWH